MSNFVDGSRLGNRTRRGRILASRSKQVWSNTESLIECLRQLASSKDPGPVLSHRPKWWSNSTIPKTCQRGVTCKPQVRKRRPKQSVKRAIQDRSRDWRSWGPAEGSVGKRSPRSWKRERRGEERGKREGSWAIGSSWPARPSFVASQTHPFSSRAGLWSHSSHSLIRNSINLWSCPLHLLKMKVPRMSEDFFPCFLRKLISLLANYN